MRGLSRSKVKATNIWSTPNPSRRPLVQCSLTCRRGHSAWLGCPSIDKTLVVRVLFWIPALANSAFLAAIGGARFLVGGLQSWCLFWRIPDTARLLNRPELEKTVREIWTRQTCPRDGANEYQYSAIILHTARAERSHNQIQTYGIVWAEGHCLIRHQKERWTPRKQENKIRKGPKSDRKTSDLRIAQGHSLHSILC